VIVSFYVWSPLPEFNKLLLPPETVRVCTGYFNSRESIILLFANCMDFAGLWCPVPVYASGGAYYYYC
jgi:hypothetical protein